VDASRLVEACALLPMLHLSAAQKNTVACIGPQAEVLAADVLRWPDVQRVYLLEPPIMIRDRRVNIGTPPPASCNLVICSPNEDPVDVLVSIAPRGLINVCTTLLDRAPAMYAAMRIHFRNITPWREWLPEPLYGAMASPAGGKQTRQRHPPKAAKRISSQYLPCLFTFGKDELPLVLPRKTTDAPEPVAADEQDPGPTPEFTPF
jgi:hypothetical protein